MRTLLLILLGLTLHAGTAVAEPPAPGDGPPPPEDRAEKRDSDDDNDHRERRRGFRLSESDAAEVLEIINRLDPELGERLTQMRKDDPDQFAREINDRFPRFHWLLRLKKYDEEMYELRVEDIRLWRESRDLAGKVREAEAAGNTDEAKELRTQLHAVVTDHFAVRQEVREAELARLERRLDELKGELEERTTKRDEFIASHVESLIADDDPHHRGRHDGKGDDDAPPPGRDQD